MYFSGFKIIILQLEISSDNYLMTLKKNVNQSKKNEKKNQKDRYNDKTTYLQHPCGYYFSHKRFNIHLNH